jgi:hypothetical protein
VTTGKNRFLKDAEALRDLRVLEEIEQDSNVSQRQLADTVGVALGVANACVWALVRKGMVKIRGESNRSITYHLTKKGVAYKASLAVEWTRNTLDFYKQARHKLADRMARLPGVGVTRVALIGIDEQVEIAAIVAPETGVTVLAVVRRDGTYLGESVSGVPATDLASALALGPDALVLLGEIDGDELERARGSSAAASVRFLDLAELR